MSESTRFWAKVDKRGPDDCWLWTAGKTTAGYGLFRRADFSAIYAHRLSFLWANGYLPPKRHVMHRCDNPACVNPLHLSMGTHADNMADMKSKGRARGARGERHRSAKLTRTDVQAIRAAYTGKRGQMTALAKTYGVSKHSISGIVHRRTWAWLD